MSPIIEPSQARLAAYLALAAGVGPAFDADAQIVGGNLDLQIGGGFPGMAAPDLSFGIGAPVKFSAGANSFVRTVYNGPTQSGCSYKTFINHSNFALAKPNPAQGRGASFLGGFAARGLAPGEVVGPAAAPWGGSDYAYFARAFLSVIDYGSYHIRSASGFGAFLQPRDFYGNGGGAIRGFAGFRITNDDGASFLYGWFDVEYDSTAPGRLTIHGFGLNLTPDQRILAGSLTIPAPGPGSLALLAAGAGGIRRTRRRAA